MEYTGEGVEALVSVLDEMQNANLILVDKKTKSLLKCLAYYDEFRVVLSYCNKGFDFEAEKKKALQKVGEHKILRLPKNDKRLVAFVLGMLVEFDSGAKDFLSFSSEYFSAESKQESYRNFFLAVIEPFKIALVALVVGGIDDEKQETSERTIVFAASGLQQQTEYLLVAFVKAVQDAKFSDVERRDFMIMLEGFASALDTRDALIIHSIWIGLKKALISTKLCLRDIDKMEETLKLYLVVK